jgi:hypothetical protein
MSYFEESYSRGAQENGANSTMRRVISVGCSSPNITKMINWRIKGTSHLACTGKSQIYKQFGCKA